MILRRLTEQVRAQNWFAVAIDFVIVVLGVFVGIQVSNWNADLASDRQSPSVTAQLVEDLRGEAWNFQYLFECSDDVLKSAERALAALEGRAQRNDEALLIAAYRATQYREPRRRRSTYDELISAGAGALGGGVATQAAAKFGGATAAAIAAGVGTNAAGGAVIGAEQSAANAIVEGRRTPSGSELAAGAAMGAAFSGGGAALGEGIEAAGRALASSATAGQSAAQLSDAMVNGAQAPAGMRVQGLYPAAAQHPVSAAGAVGGNALSTGVANSGPLLGSDACTGDPKC